jgi:hypothetical protein
MGAAGRQRALSTFAWPVVADKLEALYHELLERERLPAKALRAA